MLPLQLQAESHVPLYVQLRDQLRSLVHSGELRPGDRIPASRELAMQLGVHRTTVANAYAELESEGLIQGHVGRGTYIRAGAESLKFTAPPPPAPMNGGSVRWESLFAEDRSEDGLHRLAQPAPKDSISFVLARPDDRLFPMHDLRACLDAVLRHEGAGIFQLGSTDGYPGLRQALLEFLRAEGVSAQEENLLITNGCQQSLDLMAKAFLRPGDAVVLENPAYPGAITICSGARTRCLGVAVRTEWEAPGAEGLDIGALEATLAANRVKLMIVTPDFHNPTGTSLPLEARRKLLELASRYQVPIVEDHIYARLHLRGEQMPSLKQLDRTNVVVQIDSFSKFAFPGLRVGWIVGPANVIERLRWIKQATDLHTGQLAQAALAEFTRRGLLLKHLTRTRRIYLSRLEALEAALERHMPEETRWTHPRGGMCVWLELPSGFDASEMLIHARGKGVSFAPGRYFYSQGHRPNTLRLGFVSVEEKEIERGMATLGEVLRSEMRKRRGGARRVEASRVALV